MPRKEKDTSGESAPEDVICNEANLRRLAVIEQYQITPSSLDNLVSDLTKSKVEIFDTLRLILHFGAPQHQIAAAKLLIDWESDINKSGSSTLPKKFNVILDDDAKEQ